MGTTKDLIYMYVSDRPSGTGINGYSCSGVANKFMETVKTDGVVKMLDYIASIHYLRHVYVLIDSKYGIGSYAFSDTSLHTTIEVVPNMNTAVKDLIGKEDLVMVRGGFKAWIPVLEELRIMPNYVLFYRANTGNNHWPYWDVILDDLMSTAITSKSRWYYPFVKPVNEDIFDCSCYEGQIFDYDLCVGASHIHRKKGQYNILNSIYKNRYINPYKNIVVPGSFIRCSTNKDLMKIVPDLGAVLPGFLHKEELANLYNSSKIFIHSAVSGQNDRSLLEALCCGVPAFIIEPRIIPPILRISGVCEDFINIIDPKNIFDDLKTKYYASSSKWTNMDFRRAVHRWYLKSNGLKQATVPSFLTLLDWLEKNTKKDLNCLKNSCKKILDNWIIHDLNYLSKIK